MDSRSAAGGMGLTVLGAAAAAIDGGDGAACVAQAEKTREALKMWFAIDTLEYLRRGGRIGGARAWIGSALKIKPILTLEEEITPVERVRTRARSLERLRDYARQRHEQGLDGWVVQYIQDEETASGLIEDAHEIFGCEPVFTSEIGAVLGAHVGPGLLGIGSVPTELVTPSERGSPSLAAATEHRPHADREADHGSADNQLAAVLVDLAAPVGQLGDAAAQGLDRAAQLAALDVDVATDLGRGATGGAGSGRAGRVDAHLPLPLTTLCSMFSAALPASRSNIVLVSLASSIACAGTGGEPALTAL